MAAIPIDISRGKKIYQAVYFGIGLEQFAGKECPFVTGKKFFIDQDADNRPRVMILLALSHRIHPLFTFTFQKQHVIARQLIDDLVAVLSWPHEGHLIGFMDPRKDTVNRSQFPFPLDHVNGRRTGKALILGFFLKSQDIDIEIVFSHPAI